MHHNCTKNCEKKLTIKQKKENWGKNYTMMLKIYHAVAATKQQSNNSINNVYPPHQSNPKNCKFLKM